MIARYFAQEWLTPQRETPFHHQPWPWNQSVQAATMPAGGRGRLGGVMGIKRRRRQVHRTGRITGGYLHIGQCRFHPHLRPEDQRRRGLLGSERAGRRIRRAVRPAGRHLHLHHCRLRPQLRRQNIRHPNLLGRQRLWTVEPAGGDISILSSGTINNCGVRTDGEIVCWAFSCPKMRTIYA